MTPSADAGRRINKTASVFAYGFVGLSAVFMVVGPFVVFFLLFGPMVGAVFAVALLAWWAFFAARIVQIRRRRYGRFWPTKWA